jgi:ABC-type uncharacterized transport system permease subunit
LIFAEPTGAIGTCFDLRCEAGRCDIAPVLVVPLLAGYFCQHPVRASAVAMTLPEQGEQP